MRSLLNRLKNEESGQDLIEYALLAALIAVAAAVALGALGGKIGEIFKSVKESLNPPAPAQ